MSGEAHIDTALQIGEIRGVWTLGLLARAPRCDLFSALIGRNKIGDEANTAPGSNVKRRSAVNFIY